MTESCRQDKPPCPYKRLIPAAGLAMTLALIILMMQFPAAVERYYVHGVGGLIATGLSLLTRWLPFSLMDLFLFLVLLLMPALLIWIVRRVVVRRAGLGSDVFRILCGVPSVVMGILVVFYVVWGMAYARPKLVDRAGWKPLIPTSDAAEKAARVEELRALCDTLVDSVNAAYRESAGSEDLGRPSAPQSMTDVDASIEEAYGMIAKSGAFPEPWWGFRRGPAKPVRLLSGVMSRATISGVYCPFTGEANYNAQVPVSHLPHTIAHEKAHQRMVTSEDEANFFGFLACAYSRDSYARYSGLLFAQRQLINQLARFDVEGAKTLLKRRHPGVQRDVDAERAFWAQYQEGVLDRVSQKVNDTYLKVNGIREGTMSYGLSAELLILLSRQNREVFGGKS